MHVFTKLAITASTAILLMASPTWAQQQQTQANACANPNSSEAFQACVARGEAAGHRGKGAQKWCQANNNGCPTSK